MNVDVPAAPTPDERAMAALAHVFGIVAALIVWATQKDRSRFLRFQALQAMAFDMLFLAVYVLFMFCMVGVIFVFVLEAAWFAAQASPPNGLYPAMTMGMMVPWLMFSCVMPVALAAMIVRIFAAVSVATGHNFRYPLIARRVEAFLREPAAGA